MGILLYLTIVVSLLLISSNNKLFVHGEISLHIAGFFPMGLNVSEGSVGRGVLPAVKLALFHINNDKRILKDYKVHITWNNTQCSAADGMKAFFDMMHDPPVKYMLFGDACTQVTDPIAKASKHWKIVQLSYADMHPMFSKKNFPNLYRIVPSENEFNEPRIELLKKFNWTKVGTLYQNQPRYSLAHNKLVSDLETVGVEVVAAQSFSDDISYQMAKLKEKDVRIILGNFNETWARRIFCEAFQEKLFGRKYQWLIVAAYTTHWWRKRDVNCTVEEVETALKGAILMDLNPLSTSQEITVSGMTASQYEELYKIVNLGEYSRFHGYAYDGIWAIALAFHNISKYMNTERSPRHVLRNFRYHDDVWEKAFLNALEDTFFMGVTGPVRFRDNGRKGTVLIKQFQAFNTVNAEVKVGEFDGVTQHMNLAKGGDIVWNNGKNPPQDRTIQIIEHTRVNLMLYLVMTILSCIGIILACFFLIVNIKFRNQRYIKMSSPYLNNLIIIGCMFTYVSVILLGLDSKLTSIDAFPYICTARAWVLMAGFSIAFGSMFSKTWRVHSIFTNVKLNKKVIKDMQLFAVVGILLGIDFAIMTSWHFIDPMYRDTKQLKAYANPQNENIEIIPENEYCKSDYMSYFVGIIYAYKGLLMMFGCFLAWETRHVSIPALNDSKYIGMSVYNCVMMCVLGAPLSHVLSDQQDAGFLIISVFIIFCTTATLCLVFLPKVIELRRNPKGTVEKRLRTTTTLLKPPGSSSSHTQNASQNDKASSISNRRGSGVSIYETELKTAKQHNIKIRKQIRDIDNEIQAIAKLLGKEDLDVQRILKEAVVNLQTPKSEVLKKEDTDVSSLYSLNSDGGGDNVFMDDEYDEEDEEDEEEELPKKKYPGIAEGLAGLVNVNMQQHWSSNLAKTLINVVETEKVLNSNNVNNNSKIKLPAAAQQKEKHRSSRKVDSKSVYNLNVLKEELYFDEKIRKCVSFDELNKKKPVTPASKTTQDDLWKLMLQKEQSRYLNDRNSQKVQCKNYDKNLRIQGEEAFINGDHGGHHSSSMVVVPTTTSDNIHHHHQPVCSTQSAGISETVTKCQSLSRIMEEDQIKSEENNKLKQNNKLTNRSYSVPRRLDKNSSLNLLNSSSSEINLDVSLLPIFHKILSEQQRPRSKKSKFMVSCPNILIKCDIVEYL